ncbi:MAG: phospholipase D-like domain-containing protein, partial [Saezia sp.]
MKELLLNLLPIVWGGYLIVLSIWIILEKRSPQATIGWLLALAWFPVVGWMIYYLVGPRKLKRHTLVRVQNRDVLTTYRTYLKEQLDKALQFYPDLKLDEHGLHGVDDAAYEALAAKRVDFRLPSLISSEARQISRIIYESTGLPITIASDYELLEDGSQTFGAIFDAIRNAKHTIHVEYYIYEPDETGTQLRDLLTEKAQQGVKVRVLLDWLGSRRISHHYMADFLKAGGELDFFHKGGLPQLQSLVNMRLHRKIVVCDGCVGFTGGVNISDIQDARKTEHANHDLHIKVEGPVAYWLDEVFLEDWYYTMGKIPSDIPAPVPLESVPLNKMQQVQV